MIGTIYGDQWNTTLSIVPSALGELGMPPVDDPTLTGIANDVSTWFSSTGATTGSKIISDVKLVSIKLNRIGTDGRYVDPTTKEHLYPSPIPGPESVSQKMPAQLTVVASLRTAIERGRGAKGRMYLPTTSTTIGLGADGRMAASTALNHSASINALITALNTRYTLIGRVGVASNAGTGRFEHVTRVATGRVVDTMRSRRSSLVEDYQELPV